MNVELKHKEKFKKVLKNYTISPRAQKVLDEVNFTVLIGVAAAGRNTIINELEKQFDYTYIISDTTRPPKFRDGKMEQHGVNYYFRSEEGMLEDLENGEFLEAELIHDQQVSGISIRELEKAAESGATAINEVEFGGAMNILEAKTDTKVIAVFPPSYEVWQKRLMAREKISEQELKNRLNTALKVIDLVNKDKRIFIVVNDEFHFAAERIQKINTGEIDVTTSRARAEELLEAFKTQIEEHLARF